MTFDKLTWGGLVVVVCGWVLLIAGTLMLNVFGRSIVLNFGDLAHCTIVTGFGLALLGALSNGFGALNRFFERVLERTARVQDGSSIKKPALAKPGPSKPALLTAPIRKPKPKKVVERGRLKDRAYVLFMDGTVEIETLLGLRQFSSLRDARDFVG